MFSMKKQYSNRIHFISNENDIPEFSNIRIFKIDCENIHTTNKLFETFSNILEFPAYFGQNWDAFNECLWDMEWIKDKYKVSKIEIYIFNIQHLLDKENEQEKRIFFDIINQDYFVASDDEQGKLNFPMDIQLFFNESEKDYFILTPVTMLWNSEEI
nr:MAG TPA: barstar [Caudoviricetes sp.]